MTRNVGGIDRGVRIVLGVILLVVGFSAPLGVVWKTVVFVLAAVALVTGASGTCGLYALMGTSTRKGE